MLYLFDLDASSPITEKRVHKKLLNVNHGYPQACLFLKKKYKKTEENIKSYKNFVSLCNKVVPHMKINKFALMIKQNKSNLNRCGQYFKKQ